MSETTLVKTIQTTFGKGDVRLWRNNVGEGWQGHAHRNAVGKLVIVNPRRLIFGLCPGSSDLIGFRSVEITPQMVGQRVAVFTAIEVKANAKSPFRDGQEEFLHMIGNFGGIAGSTHTVDGAEVILEGYDL
jgi:hypothetical protein